MENEITEIMCSDVSDFRIKLQTNLNFENPIFRGVSDSEYKLESTYERLLNGNSTHHTDATEIVLFTEILKAEKVKPKKNQFAKLDDMMMILAKMQHHGAPTRLLDWTEDINVALYFASKSDNQAKNMAVYTIDLSPVREIKNVLNSIIEEDWLNLNSSLTESQKFFTGRELEVCFYKMLPNLLPRIDAQKGLFLFSGNLYFDFIHNLYKSRFNPIKHCIVKKFIIPKTDITRRAILSELSDKYNINDKTLFPGSDYKSDELKQIAKDFIKTIFP